jgi:hypothetical protein
MPSKGIVHGLLILSPFKMARSVSRWNHTQCLSAYAARANATSLSFAVMFCGTLPVNSLGVPITRKSILVRPHHRYTVDGFPFRTVSTMFTRVFPRQV